MDVNIHTHVRTHTQAHTHTSSLDLRSSYCIEFFELFQLQLNQRLTIMSKFSQKDNIDIGNHLPQSFHNALLRSLNCIHISRFDSHTFPARRCIKSIKYIKEPHFCLNSSYIYKFLNTWSKGTIITLTQQRDLEFLFFNFWDFFPKYFPKINES